MIGEKICIRRVGLFIFLATLLCSWDVVCFQGKKTAKEATLSYVVDLPSLYTDEDTVRYHLYALISTFVSTNQPIQYSQCIFDPTLVYDTKI